MLVESCLVRYYPEVLLGPTDLLSAYREWVDCSVEKRWRADQATANVYKFYDKGQCT